MTGLNNIIAAPSIAVSSDGTVGIIFYDHRNNTSANYPSDDPPHITDTWLDYLPRNGAHWFEKHVSGPFDQTIAFSDDLGEYQGMVAVPGGFATAFGQVNPISSSDPSQSAPHNTDIFFSKIDLSAPLTRIVSRKTQGSAGMFDVDLPQSGALGIEPRDGSGKGNYTVVFTFQNNVTSVGSATVTSGTGKVASSSIAADRHQYIVNLTGVTNAQRITVTLGNVADSGGNTSRAISATMGVLIGDVNGDGLVTSSDVDQVKAQSNQRVTIANFRDDVTIDGAINGSDMSLVKSKAGTRLP